MKNKNIIIASIIIILVAVMGIVGYNKFLKEKTDEGSKNIIITVINDNDGYKKVYNHKTNQDTLGRALDEMKIIETSKSNFGRYVEKVDGISVDKGKEQWWKFKINGSDCQSGIDETAINDGDKVDIIFTTGW